MTSPVCQQCGRPTFHIYEDEQGTFGLCLDCSLKYQHILELQREESERQYNQALGDLEAISGVRTGMPRFPPRQRPVLFRGSTLNNIHLHNSTVAILNTGSIERADVAIGAIKAAGENDLAGALKVLAEAIAESPDLQIKNKNDALEMLSAVATEASQPADQRRAATMRPVVNGLGEIIKLAPGVNIIWQKVVPLLDALFSQINQ